MHPGDCSEYQDLSQHRSRASTPPPCPNWAWFRVSVPRNRKIKSFNGPTVLRNHSSLNFHMLGDLSILRDLEVLKLTAIMSMSSKLQDPATLMSLTWWLLAVSFISLCYGCKPEPNGKSTIPARINLWHRKVATATCAKPTRLCSDYPQKISPFYC